VVRIAFPLCVAKPHARDLLIGMPDHLRQFIGVRRKAIRMFQFAPETYPSLPLIGISTTI